ncbi:MAG: flagellar biosynthesis protein FlhB [Clostridiales bacterium]|nr:flagellar biosynthesis protein FlhB [Clostridiales bacterium]
MDLQLFAGEKTEKATPKRRREAREKGQVIKSIEINASIMILITFTIIKLFAGNIMGNLKNIFVDYLYMDMPIDTFFTYSGLHKNLIDITIKSFLTIFPILASCLIVAIVVNYLQVGFIFTGAPLKPDLNRINPIQGFKRLFSKRSIYELLKSLVKLGIIIGVVYDVFFENIRAMPSLLDMQIGAAFGYILAQIFNIAIRCGFALLAMSVFDYIYQWWDYEKDLRMTKHEVKEEYKETEGDPEVKRRIRQLQRQMSMSRMMQEIPKADVVIVNPTHIAVAIVYDSDENDAPIVIAKGQGYVAENIKERARQHNIAIVEDKPLAKTLYDTTEIGSVIPAELYHAVAEVLAYVYSLDNER